MAIITLETPQYELFFKNGRETETFHNGEHVKITIGNYTFEGILGNAFFEKGEMKVEFSYTKDNKALQVEKSILPTNCISSMSLVSKSVSWGKP